MPLWVGRINVASGSRQLVDVLVLSVCVGGGGFTLSSEPFELFGETKKVYKHTGALCSTADPLRSLFRVDVIHGPLAEEKSFLYLCMERRQLPHWDVFQVGEVVVVGHMGGLMNGTHTFRNSSGFSRLNKLDHPLDKETLSLWRQETLVQGLWIPSFSVYGRPTPSPAPSCPFPFTFPYLFRYLYELTC